jgi:group I intron endonuclease
LCNHLHTSSRYSKLKSGWLGYKIPICISTGEGRASTQKCYIEFTISGLERRKQRHLLKARKGSNCAFHKALREWGEESWSWEILVEITDPNKCLNVLEPYYIRKFNSFHTKNGYNMTYGGDGTLGCTHSEETKKKMSSIAKDRMKKRCAQIPKTLLIDLYITQGKTIKTVAEICEVKPGVIGKLFQYYGIQARKRWAKPKEQKMILIKDESGKVQRKHKTSTKNRIGKLAKERYKDQINSIPKDALIALYIGQKKTISEIAKTFGVCAMTIHKRLVQYDIPRRPRGNPAG